MSASHGYSRLPLTLRFALREFRGGLKGFRVFFACLALGVAAIAGVGALTDALLDGLRTESRALLGGDAEVRVFQQEANAEQRAYFEQAGDVSSLMRMRAMARASRSGERTLVELKAVDGAYPLYGEMALTPEANRASLFQKEVSHWGAVIAPTLAERLRIGVGDEVLIGDAAFTVRALLEKEPDRANEGFQLGPTAMIGLEAMDDTGLIRVGSLVNYHYRIRMPEETDTKAWVEQTNERFADESWRVRDHSNSAPGIRNFVNRMGMFLTLVGLTALVVGGVGVGNAVRAYLDSKTETIAILKVLGAEGALIFRIYLAQVMGLALVSIVAGLLIGAGIPLLFTEALSDQLPISPEGGIHLGTLVTASAYGFLITLAFAVWPLARAREIPAARLFRSLIAPERRLPELKYIAVIIGSIAAIIALAIGLNPLKALAAGFAAAAAGSLLLLRFTGWLIQKAAARMPRFKRPGLRIAIANIHRPGSATGPVVLSLGLGFTLFAVIALVEGNLNLQVAESLPDKAPAFFFIDIQKDEHEGYLQTVNAIAGVSDVRTVPSLRGKVEFLNGVPVADAEIASDVRWVVRGDRGLTFATGIPKGNELVEGDWWPADYSGPPLVSLGVDEAAGLGLKLGDTMTVNVLGREITATVANLRRINWDDLGLNFLIVFAPGALDAAPYTYLSTLAATAEAEPLVHRAVTDSLPHVTAVRMKDVFDSLNGMLQQIGTAVRVTALITVIAGILVLAGALAAGHRHRVYDAVILKVLGAIRRDVLRAYVTEYAILGLVTGIVAIGLGTLAGYVVVHEVMDMTYTFLPGAMILTIVSSIAITIFFGLAGTWRALAAKPARILREN